MNQADRNHFAHEGYVVVSGLVAEECLREAVPMMDRLFSDDVQRTGPSSKDVEFESESPIFSLLEGRPWQALSDLVAPGELARPAHAQLIRNAPPYLTESDGPHIDKHNRGADRPESFTLLVAILLSDQRDPDAGNVWVWPGTHRLNAEYLEAYGPTALLEHSGKIMRAVPHIRLPRPVSICGTTGDVVIAHPLLGHDSGPNRSNDVRKAVYFRLTRTDHTARWEECVTQPLLEYDVATDDVAS